MARKVLVIDETGARAASLAENRTTLEERQRAAFGEDLAMTPQTPQSQWAGIGALALTEVGEEGVRAAKYGASVDDAEGTYLDAHGGLLDVRRRVATHSRVTAILTGEAGTAVEAGSRAKTAPGGDVFETVDTVVLSPGGVAVSMQAVEVGPVPAPAGTLTEIVTVIAGWETITNPEDAVLGVVRQSDHAYKAVYRVRTAHSSIGPLAALQGALEEALAGRQRIEENRDDSPIVEQEWTIGAHASLVLAETGSDADVTRAVENHRGMGSGTMTAIRAAAHTDAALAVVSNGAVTWNGTEYLGLDLRGAGDGPARAAALTALLANDPTPPTVSFIDGAYVAIFRWRPVRTPNFAAGTVVDAFGFSPDESDYPAGPFVRPRVVPLTVSMTLTRRPGFPADGLDQVRQGVLARVLGAERTRVLLGLDELARDDFHPTGYGIGEEIWSNDLLCEAEYPRGTRITDFVVQAGGADVSGVAVALDVLWSLAVTDIAINVA